MLHYNSEEQIADNAKAFISHSAYLARVIKEWVPDVIHILGINVNWRSNGEVLLKVLERNRDQKPCPIIVSTWGADLDLYPSKGETEHKEVEAILKITDGLLVEGERDESLARKLGFRGQILAKLPAFGGVTWEAKDFSSTVVPSQRKVIILKGRDNKDALGKGGDPQGRAMTAIRAFSLCEDVIKPYSIIVTQASPAIVEAVNQLKKDTKIKISISNMLTYKKWLDLLNKARIVLAVTVSDGLPSTLVEAMSLGTFPIHSGLETVREWIQDGENGFLVEPEDIQGVALALRRTLLDDELVDRAAEINANLVESYLSEKVILPKIMRLYEQIPLWYKLGSPPFERIS